MNFLAGINSCWYVKGSELIFIFWKCFSNGFREYVHGDAVIKETMKPISAVLWIGRCLECGFTGFYFITFLIVQQIYRFRFIQQCPFPMSSAYSAVYPQGMSSDPVAFQAIIVLLPAYQNAPNETQTHQCSLIESINSNVNTRTQLIVLFIALVMLPLLLPALPHPCTRTHTHTHTLMSKWIQCK